LKGIGGPARDAGLARVIAIAPAGEHGVFFISAGRVLKVDSSGNLSFVGGNGANNDSGDGGPAVLAGIWTPTQLTVDESGNVFVADSASCRIRRISAVDGSIQTIVGTGAAALSADGLPATRASINGLLSMTLGPGVLYLAEEGTPSGQSRIRAVSSPEPPPLPQPPQITKVANAAEPAMGVSPGSIASIYGHYLGPASPVSLAFGRDGRVTTTLGGVSVQGPAPILYVSAGQVNVALPVSLPCTAPGNTFIQLNNDAGRAFWNGDCYGSALAFFPGAVLNEDRSINDASHPARIGSVVTLFGTGMGATTPRGVDGEIINGPEFPKPVLSFDAFVSRNSGDFGQQTDLLYLGSAPGLVFGAVQANVRIPPGVTAGLQYIFLRPNPRLGSQGPAGAPVFISAIQAP
jgi:uncharacterized protein (TIGR03437 family)